MKKMFLTLAFVIMSLIAMAEPTSTVVSNYSEFTKVEQLNDSTLLYQNVETIVITQACDNEVKIYDSTDTLVYEQAGSFKVTLPEGDYKIVSTTPFTRAESRTRTEYTVL